MNVRQMEQSVRPYFLESPEWNRGNDINANNQYRFVKRVPHKHASHPSTTHFIALNLLTGTGDAVQCRVSRIWQT